MIYLFVGRDTFSRRKAVAELKGALGPPETQEVNITLLPGASLAPDELLGICRAVPFLAERRLVLVERLLEQFNERLTNGRPRDATRPPPVRRDPSAWEEALASLKELPPTTDLVFLEDVVNPNNPLHLALRPVATVQEFTPLPPDQLRRWVADQARLRGLALMPQAQALLVDMIGPDLWSLTNELDKLVLWASGRTLAEEDVTRLVSAAREVRIFSTVDAIVERNASRALRRLQAFLAQGEATPPQVRAMLARQVRLMLLAHALLRGGVPQQQLGTRLGVSGYPLQKTLEQARRYTWPHLVWFHERLLEADVAIKTGALDEMTALEVLVTEVCGPPRPDAVGMLSARV